MQSNDTHTLFRIINDAHSPLGDLYFGLISGLGDGLVVALCCSLLMLFHLRAGMAGLLAFILSGLFAQLLKRIFDMPRPPAVLEHVHVLGHTLTMHSFPSGHSTSAGVMILLALLIWSHRRWQAWLAITLFASAALGRIYGGVHFPLDVSVGLLLGIVTMWLCWRWSASWSVAVWAQSVWAWKFPAMIVACEAAVLGLGYHVQPATSQPLALILPLVSLFILAQVWKEKLTHE